MPLVLEIEAVNEPSFKCVCVDDILINYGNISNTYLNADITRKVLDLLSEEYGVEVQYISDLEELWGIREESFCTKNALWEEGIKAIKEVGTGYFSELKVFRLQLDSVLISIRKQKGTYYIHFIVLMFCIYILDISHNMRV